MDEFGIQAIDAELNPAKANRAFQLLRRIGRGIAQEDARIIEAVIAISEVIIDGAVHLEIAGQACFAHLNRIGGLADTLEVTAKDRDVLQSARGWNGSESC